MISGRAVEMAVCRTGRPEPYEKESEYQSWNGGKEDLSGGLTRSKAESRQEKQSETKINQNLSGLLKSTRFLFPPPVPAPAPWVASASSYPCPAVPVVEPSFPPPLTLLNWEKSRGSFLGSMIKYDSDEVPCNIPESKAVVEEVTDLVPS
jgi:hypothetical protein